MYMSNIAEFFTTFLSRYSFRMCLHILIRHCMSTQFIYNCYNVTHPNPVESNVPKTCTPYIFTLFYQPLFGKTT